MCPLSQEQMLTGRGKPPWPMFFCSTTLILMVEVADLAQSSLLVEMLARALQSVEYECSWPGIDKIGDVVMTWSYLFLSQESVWMGRYLEADHYLSGWKLHLCGFL